LGGGVVADQVFENRKDVLAVLDDALEQRAQPRLADGFLIPLRKHGAGHFDIAAEFSGRMTTQKEAVEKRGFTLRELLADWVAST
jgi:hypothetical protein